MLLQRMRVAEPAVEAAIAYNLVDLAFSAPQNAFLDIVRTFSNISRTADPEDPGFPNNVVWLYFSQLFEILILSSRSWPHKLAWRKGSGNAQIFGMSTYKSSYSYLPTKV